MITFFVGCIIGALVVLLITAIIIVVED